MVRLWDAASHKERLDLWRAGKFAITAHFPADGRRIVVVWGDEGDRSGLDREVVIYPLDVLGVARAARFGDMTPDERDQFQVGSPEERREYRRAWRKGHIFGQDPGER